jgi:3-oxoacyl-(acyl-carrier-protein) synthase
LLRSAPPVEPFRVPPRGTILSEGAGAILLGRDGLVKLDQTHAGGDYSKRDAAAEVLEVILAELASGDTDLIVCSANGTFVDQAEAQAISQLRLDGALYTVKPALGESVGASGVWQVIVAVQALQTGELPPLLHSPPQMPFGMVQTSRVGGRSCALVVSCGLNQQVAGLRLANRP